MLGSRRARRWITAALCLALLHGCSTRAQDEDTLGPAECERGDACNEAGDCPVIDCGSVTTAGGTIISFSGAACVKGRCVVDTCACSADPNICCYPELAPDPKDYDGDWLGQGDEVSFATTFAGPANEVQPFAGAVQFWIAEGSVVAIEFDWIVPACEVFPPVEGAEPVSVEGHQRFDFAPGEIPITPYGSTDWWSSDFFTQPNFTLSIWFESTRQARVEIDVSIFGSDPPYSCYSGHTAILYDAERH